MYLGNSFRQKPQVTSTTPVGTCDYISPEVLQAHEGNVQYGTEVDWWSVGIVLFEMLQELPPFYSDSVNDTYRKIIFHEVNKRLPKHLKIYLRVTEKIE